MGGDSLSDNPYKEGSDYFYAWRDGFLAAC